MRLDEGSVSGRLDFPEMNEASPFNIEIYDDKMANGSN